MEHKNDNWRRFVRVLAFPGIFMILAEVRMVMELVFRLHSYFLSSVHNKGNMLFFIFAMVIIPWPLLGSALEFRKNEKVLRSLGADEKVISRS